MLVINRDECVLLLVCVQELNNSHLDEVPPVQLLSFDSFDQLGRKKRSSSLAEYQGAQNPPRGRRNVDSVRRAFILRCEIRDSPVWVDLAFAPQFSEWLCQHISVLP